MIPPWEFLSLVGIGLANQAYRTVLDVREACHLGRHRWWWRLRTGLGRQYLWDPPARIVRHEGAQTGLHADNLVWGETPCLTLERILDRVGAGAADVLVDLGCGRGLTVFFAHLRYGMRAIGFEAVPGFVRRAERVARALGIEADGVAFRNRNFLEDDIGGGTIYLLSWTTFPTEVQRQCKTKLAALPPGTRIITLSYPLADPAIRRRYCEWLPFSWGEASVHYHEVVGADPDRPA